MQFEYDNMVLKILGKYDFAGPYESTDKIEDRSGLYIVFYETDDAYNYLDVGEASGVKSRLDTHDRKDCWKRHAKGKIVFFVMYTPNLQQTGRKEIEQEIRQKKPVKCGEQ